MELSDLAVARRYYTPLPLRDLLLNVVVTRQPSGLTNLTGRAEESRLEECCRVRLHWGEQRTLPEMSEAFLRSNAASTSTNPGGFLFTSHEMDDGTAGMPLIPAQGVSRLARLLHREKWQPNIHVTGGCFNLLWAFPPNLDSTASNSKLECKPFIVVAARFGWEEEESEGAGREGCVFTARPALDTTWPFWADTDWVYKIMVEVVGPAPIAGLRMLLATPRADSSSCILQDHDKTAEAKVVRSASEERGELAERSAAVLQHCAAFLQDPTSSARRLLREAALRSWCRLNDIGPTVERLGGGAPLGRLCVLHGVLEYSRGLAHDGLFVRAELYQEAADGSSSDTPVVSFTTQIAFPRLTCIHFQTSQHSNPNCTSTTTNKNCFPEHYTYEDTMSEDGELEPTHVWNAPFECSVRDDGPGALVLRLVVTVLSRVTASSVTVLPAAAVAYGCVSLPVGLPGSHHCRVSLWAPHPTGREFLRAALLGGGGAALVSPQTGAGAPAPFTRTGLSVKLGLATDSVGELRLRLGVLHQALG